MGAKSFPKLKVKRTAELKPEEKSTHFNAKLMNGFTTAIWQVAEECGLLNEHSMNWKNTTIARVLNLGSQELFPI